MPSVGDILHAPNGTGRAIKLVGVIGAEWVCEPIADGSFTTPYRISAAELRSVYHVDDPSVPTHDVAAEMRRRDIAANDHAIRELARVHPDAQRARLRAEKIIAAGGHPELQPAPDSPEGIFAAAAEEANGDADD